MPGLRETLIERLKHLREEQVRIKSLLSFYSSETTTDQQKLVSTDYSKNYNDSAQKAEQENKDNDLKATNTRAYTDDLEPLKIVSKESKEPEADRYDKRRQTRLSTISKDGNSFTWDYSQRNDTACLGIRDILNSRPEEWVRLIDIIDLVPWDKDKDRRSKREGIKNILKIQGDKYGIIIDSGRQVVAAGKVQQVKIKLASKEQQSKSNDLYSNLNLERIYFKELEEVVNINTIQSMPNKNVKHKYIVYVSKDKADEIHKKVRAIESRINEEHKTNFYTAILSSGT